MLVYKDIISEDELFTDAFDVKPVGITYEVDCKMISVGPTSVDTGANASAEGEDADETVEEGATLVNNVIYSNRLQQTSFDKKSYTTYIKGYLKSIKAKLQEAAAKGGPAGEAAKLRSDAFEGEATKFVKTVLGNFKDYDFYTGESMNIDGMIVLLNYREDGVTPFLTFFKDGLTEMKV
ncbi:hypothetical protein GGI16_003474 [Coemansia sp. S142-1]|nr:hypothetical protein GGI16_003474 [Coemansia sp. S142-1]